MADVFKYKIVDFYGAHPAITADFVDEVLSFFGGGHTPEVRTALLALRKAAKDGENLLNRNAIPVVVEYPNNSEVKQIDQNFAHFVLDTFTGGHTPAIRDQLLHLERICQKNNI